MKFVLLKTSNFTFGLKLLASFQFLKFQFGSKLSTISQSLNFKLAWHFQHILKRTKLFINPTYSFGKMIKIISLFSMFHFNMTLSTSFNYFNFQSYLIDTFWIWKQCFNLVTIGYSKSHNFPKPLVLLKNSKKLLGLFNILKFIRSPKYSTSLCLEFFFMSTDLMPLKYLEDYTLLIFIGSIQKKFLFSLIHGGNISTSKFSKTSMSFPHQ